MVSEGGGQEVPTRPQRAFGSLGIFGGPMSHATIPTGTEEK